MGNPYDNATGKMSILGPTLVFKGELIAEEDLVLKGTVEGTIQHTASLKIGKEGTVKGNVKAKNITVEGTVEGDLFGAESVRVQADARVTGNIFARNVSLAEGSRFKGSIDMGNDYEAVAETPLPGAASAGK
jgi:cytoskeletal protein CcmA (bactofilin family)